MTFRHLLNSKEDRIFDIKGNLTGIVFEMYFFNEKLNKIERIIKSMDFLQESLDDSQNPFEEIN